MATVSSISRYIQFQTFGDAGAFFTMGTEEDRRLTIAAPLLRLLQSFSFWGKPFPGETATIQPRQRNIPNRGGNRQSTSMGSDHGDMEDKESPPPLQHDLYRWMTCKGMVDLQAKLFAVNNDVDVE